MEALLLFPAWLALVWKSYVFSSHCLPALMKASSSATHLALILSFVWLLPLSRNISPQPVKWSPDGSLTSFSVSLSALLSFLPPISSPFHSPTPLRCCSLQLTHNLNSLSSSSPVLLLHHVAFLPWFFSCLKWMLFPWELASGGRGPYWRDTGAVTIRAIISDPSHLQILVSPSFTHFNSYF